MIETIADQHQLPAQTFVCRRKIALPREPPIERDAIRIYLSRRFFPPGQNAILYTDQRLVAKNPTARARWRTDPGKREVRVLELVRYPTLIFAAGVRSTSEATSVIISRNQARAGSM
jgi:hypothetical protein